MTPLLLAWLGCAPPPHTLARPNAVRVTPAGVWVSDFHHQRVVSFDLDGTFLRAWGERGIGRNQLWQPFDLHVGEDGTIWVANERVRSVDDADSVWEIKRFERGRQVGAHPLIGPAWERSEGWVDALVAHPDGGWLVADSASHTVWRFPADWAEGAPWMAPRDDISPAGLAPLGDGRFAVVDETHHRIRIVDAEGRDTPLSFGTDRLRFPSDLDVCPGAWIAVADLGNHRVVRYRLDGTFLDAFEPEPVDADHPVQLLDLAVGPRCERLYLVDSKGNRLLITSPTGEVFSDLRRW